MPNKSRNHQRCETTRLHHHHCYMSSSTGREQQLQCEIDDDSAVVFAKRKQSDPGDASSWKRPCPLRRPIHHLPTTAATNGTGTAATGSDINLHASHGDAECAHAPAFALLPPDSASAGPQLGRSSIDWLATIQSAGRNVTSAASLPTQSSQAAAATVPAAPPQCAADSDNVQHVDDDSGQPEAELHDLDESLSLAMQNFAEQRSSLERHGWVAYVAELVRESLTSHRHLFSQQIVATACRTLRSPNPVDCDNGQPHAMFDQVVAACVLL